MMLQITHITAQTFSLLFVKIREKHIDLLPKILRISRSKYNLWPSGTMFNLGIIIH